MKDNNLVALACVIGATVMAVNGVSGCGWVLFLAFCAVG